MKSEAPYLAAMISMISMIYWCYPWYPDVSLMNFDKIWREITDIDIFGFRDFRRCQRSSMDLQDIHCQGRKAPVTTQTCLELSGETRFQPALSTWICLETTVKTCKNPNLMVNNVYFPHTSLFWRYLLSPYTAEWLMIYELFRNVSHVSWGFFCLDVFLAKPWNH